MMRTLLQQACDREEIRLLDLHIGLFLEKLGGRGTKNPELLLAGTLVSAAVGNGHVCQPLGQVTELSLQIDPSLIPDPDSWQKALLATPVVGPPGETTPLILDDHNRLYLYRFYQYEEQIAHDLLNRAEGIMEVDYHPARELLAQLFPAHENRGQTQFSQISSHNSVKPKENSGLSPIFTIFNGTNYQQLAAALALLKRLLVISGGPGTGKTHTVARILALIQALNVDTKPLRIGLAAPTGKAAARLEESIRNAKESMPPELARNVPEQAQTLHRLLGFRPGADDFRYNRKNPLHLDLLVVDEASMIDVVLMAALVQALPAKTRLILLGDRNQLASVEAGSLFGDLCGTGEPAWSPRLCERLRQLTGEKGSDLFFHKNLSVTPRPRSKKNKSDPFSTFSDTTSTHVMGDSVILLRTSYRFQDKSGIGSLAAAVNSGSMKQVDSVLAVTDEYPDLQVCSLTGSNRELWLQDRIILGFKAMVSAPSVEEAYRAMQKFRFLCAVRKGPAGVEGINSLAEQVLAGAGLIDRETDWYQGKPIIIRRNQYDMQLFNGDTGILWNDQEGQLRAWFVRPDNSLYPVTPARLPDHDTAYGITIHKAQGSEFDQVLLLLPEEKSRVLSRELIYTGITRARSSLILCCDPEILATAVRQRTRRHSGLADKLWVPLKSSSTNNTI